MGELISCLIDRLTLIKSFSRDKGDAVMPTGMAWFKYPTQRTRVLHLFFVLVFDQGFILVLRFSSSTRPCYNDFRTALQSFLVKLKIFTFSFFSFTFRFLRGCMNDIFTFTSIYHIKPYINLRAI